ncbi:SPARC-like protein 1 isoform X1 [Misgurnus anguillicaudatus]|uniref:SPARC-like protein 1 isoform X1 n=1 Tax=Misgurnus anguillicaudatus TaxID=75329 RepID=UPI003CCF1EAF
MSTRGLLYNTGSTRSCLKKRRRDQFEESALIKICEPLHDIHSSYAPVTSSALLDYDPSVWFHYGWKSSTQTEAGRREVEAIPGQSGSRQGAPVCSVLGKMYSNECLLHKEACRKKRRIGKAHTGACLVSNSQCTEDELGQFPYRLLDWFLLLSRMGERYTPAAPSQSCLTHTQRTQLAQTRFNLLDRNRDGKLSRRDLRKLRYKRMPLEHCAQRFFQSCDKNKNKKVTLTEWTSCLVNRSERWFQDFMSMKMGSPKLCPVQDNNL